MILMNNHYNTVYRMIIKMINKYNIIKNNFKKNIKNVFQEYNHQWKQRKLLLLIQKPY